jgi:hypothetical protein
VITYDHISDKQESHYLSKLPCQSAIMTIFEVCLIATLFALCAWMGFSY